MKYIRSKDKQTVMDDLKKVYHAQSREEAESNLYDFLEKNGVPIDKQNRNPSRLSRMPGVTRNGNRQYLVALLVQLYLVYFGLPSVGILIDAFPAAVLVFGINEGAYMAESVRGALESVTKGQIEAGSCVGMSYLQIMRHIVLPQALRTAFPSLSNGLISMVKDTSLTANITVLEMFNAELGVVQKEKNVEQ